jgi:hypothetical protein
MTGFDDDFKRKFQEAYERADLKKSADREEADDEIDNDDDSRADRCDGRPPKQSDVLIELASTAALFHTPDGTAFADIVVNGHRETWQVRSKGFRRWLLRRFYKKMHSAPNSEALQAAIGVIEAKAHFDAPERNVHVRVGEHESRLYLDLCDVDWRAVEIDARGWRIINEPPVRFRRAAGMLPLPVPLAGGSVEELRPFLNVKSDGDFVLAVTWLLAAFRHHGPFPVLVLGGEHGSAKSTFSATLRALIDPNAAALRALPREDRDLFIAANNGHVLCFDNVSGLQAWVSDTLCRLATGGAFAVRQLYTDGEEVLFDAARPIILNGIEDIVTRPDLADRALFLTLEPISEARRRTEQALRAEFEHKHPLILGALLDAVVHGLARLPDVQLDRPPRMADYALWATACETAIWPAGTFMAAYNENREDAIVGVVEADPVAMAVRTMMAEQSEWNGTASDLLAVLAAQVGERNARSKGWPDGARALSGRLRRAAPPLRNLGIEIAFTRQGNTGRRIINLRVV